MPVPQASAGDCPVGLDEAEATRLVELIRDLPKNATAVPHLQAALEAVTAIAAVSQPFADAAVDRGAFSALASCSDACFFAGVAEGVADAAAQMARRAAARASEGDAAAQVARRAAAARASEGGGAVGDIMEGLAETMHVLERTLASYISMPCMIAATAEALVRAVATCVSRASAARHPQRKVRQRLPPDSRLPLTQLLAAPQAEVYLLDERLIADPETKTTMAALVGCIADRDLSYARPDPHAALVRSSHAPSVPQTCAAAQREG